MSNIRSWVWPDSVWTDLMPFPAPPGWPAGISNALYTTGLPALSVPVMIQEAAIFHLRALTANITLDFTNDGGATTQTALMGRYKDYGGVFSPGVPILQDQEHLLIPGKPGYYIWRPWYYVDSGIVPIGPDGDFISWQFGMNTECIWDSIDLDIAFFNLRAQLHVTCRLGEPSDPHETEFFARTLPFNPLGGTWDITLGMTTVAGIPFNEAAALVQADLIGAGFGDLTVTSADSGMYFVTWTQPGLVAPMTGDGTNLLPGGSVVVTVIRSGDETTTAKQLIQLIISPGGVTGNLAILSGSIPMESSGNVTGNPDGDNYSFALGNFDPQSYFRYNGVWDAATGARLTPPVGPG